MAADSARPRVSSKGHTMPEVRASSAPATSSERFGSKARAWSPVSSSMSVTPFFTPRPYSSCSLGRSSVEKHTTKAPIRLKGISSSSESWSIIWLPRTFILAFQVPGSASNPAWTMAEFALLVPLAHVQRPLCHQKAALPAGKLSGHGGAGDAGANHNHVILFHSCNAPIS